VIKEREGQAPTMNGPSIYEIHVRGHLEEKWSDQLGGLQIIATQGSNRKQETIIVGRLIDQAALTGVLHTLYELHLPVVSVQCVDSDGK
jgi:hypothetical protein